MKPNPRRGFRYTLILPALFCLSCTPEPHPEQGTSRSVPALSLEEFRKELADAEIWIGGPDYTFEKVGRDALAVSIKHGLMPDHKVLDIGAGSLRIGWWLLQYVEPENYYAIEPVEERINTAAKLLDVENIHVFHNMDFEFPDAKFDLVIARSIWTHASKGMISKMLSEFAENAAPDGRFLTSVILAQSEEEDYKGTEWYGKVEKSDKGGLIAHSLDWIDAECTKNGLVQAEVGVLFDHTWLLIKKEDDQPGELPQ